MPKIVIKEVDNTSPGSLGETFEVVYIPGFVDTSLKELYDADGKYIGLPYHAPRVFTSINEFKSVCGSTPATFAADQMYTDLINDNTNGFSLDAIPFHNTMFKKGTKDPSYLMAMELLNSGLAVLYERINDDSQLTAKINFNASDFAEGANQVDYKKCVFYKDDVFMPIETLFAPDGDNVFEKYGPSTETLTLPSGNDTDKDILEAILVVDELGRYVHPAVYKKVDGIDEFDLDSSVDKLIELLEDKKGVVVEEVAEGNTVSKTVTFPKDLVSLWVVGNIGKVVEGSDTPTVVDEMPDDWYTNFRNYKMLGTEVVEGKDLEKAPTTGYSKYAKFVDTMTIANVYGKELPFVFNTDDDRLKDRGNFSIKYLTSGAYPTYEYDNNSISNAMLSLCESRGDCYALIEHTDNEFRTLNPALDASLYRTVAKDVSFNGDSASYGAMFTPWANYTITTMSDTARMPAGYAYLMSLAASIETNASWLAVAGAARGVVRNLAKDGMNTVISNGVADMMQERTKDRAVNAITNIQPYGYVIWGNRTLATNKDDLTASNFLNVRNLMCDVKKTCYRVARRLTFEQNNDVLWVNFQAGIAPLLDRMVSGYGLTGYRIEKDLAHEKASAKATLCAKILLYPVYPVEDFYITIQIEDDNITVE